MAKTGKNVAGFFGRTFFILLAFFYGAYLGHDIGFSSGKATATLTCIEQKIAVLDRMIKEMQ